MGVKWNPVAPVVLIADDDPAMRRFETQVLTDAGFNVRPAMSVAQACEQLNLPGVSAAVIDMLFVNSDGRSGLDILKYIRTHPHTSSIPVLVVTGFDLNQGVVDEVRAMGGELWHKPVDPDFLVQRLHDLLYQHPIGC